MNSTRMRARLLLRQATSSIGASIAIVLIVAVAAGLFTAWPRLARATFVDEFNYRIEQTPVTARALTGSQVGGWPVFSWADATYAEAMEQLDAAVADAGPTLQPQLGEPELLITMGGLLTGAPIPFEGPTPRPSDLAGRLLVLRAIDSVVDHVEIVDGEAPAAWVAPDSGANAELVVDPVPVMFSVETADRIGVAVGDILTGLGEVFLPDGNFTPMTAVVVGIFEGTDPDEAYWQFQTSGLQPLITTSPNEGDSATGAAYVHADTAEALSSTSVSARTDVWIPVAAGAEDAPALLDDLLEITAREITLGPQDFGGVQIELETALIDVLETSITAQRGTAAVLTLVAAGPVGVTFALLALTTRLSVSRRRDTLALASARGGSPAQIRGALGIEGLVIGLPAAAIGAAAATLAIPGTAEPSDYLLPLLAGLAPATFLAAESLPNLRTRRHDLTAGSGSQWRWVVEALVVAAAAAAVYLLLSRGLQATTTDTVDPLATAAPLLICLATAVLATRLFPYPMRVVHAAARRRRDLPAFLGSARAIREGTAGLVPMLALLVATSIAVFSTAMLSTLSSGVDQSTRSTTGADVRMAGPPYMDDVVAEVAATAGVAEVARVFTQNETRWSEGTDTQQIALYAVDTDVLEQVQTGVDGAVTLPDGMGALVDGAVPVVVSSSLAPEDGAALSIRMNENVPATLVGIAPSAAGIAERAQWVIVDLELLREVTGQNLVPRLLLVDAEEGADVAAVTAALSDVVGGQGTIESVQGQEEDFLASPSAESMQVGFWVALGLSVLQSVLALVLTLVLAAPARGRLVAVLRTLGMRPGDARRLVSWELVPLAVVALLAGTALGLALPQLVVRTVDLSAFTGLSSPTVVYDWPRLALVLAGVGVVIGVTLLVASAVARRLSLSTLRIGDAS